METLAETPRERLERRNHDRAEVEQEARPWRLAFMVLFGAWVAWHFWLWSQRGERPRIEGLDEQLTLTRWLNAGAFLWILIMHPVSLAWHGLVGLVRGKDRAKARLREQAVGSSVPASPKLGAWERLSWIIPCVASIGLFLGYYILGASSIAVAVLLLALPWAPVVYITRRAFPGGRNELVVAALLAFFAVGIAHSFANRGFYEWKYQNKGVRFVIPRGESSLVDPQSGSWHPAASTSPSDSPPANKNPELPLPRANQALR